MDDVPAPAHLIKNLIMIVCLFVLFCCFSSKSTAMVMGGRSVHLTTLFPG